MHNISSTQGWLNQANPFDYLTELQRHVDELAARPDLWMPWNYRARPA